MMDGWMRKSPERTNDRKSNDGETRIKGGKGLTSLFRS